MHLLKDLDPRSVPGIINSPYIIVSAKQQVMYVLADHNTLLKQYVIGTAANGMGEQKDSFKTPRGWHQIRALIGANQPINTVFKARRPTGEIFSPDLDLLMPNRDWILTRILWLSGLEPGFNRFGDVDTMQRYVYIHGSPEHKVMGIPGSKGCINMRNLDIIELFNQIKFGTKVFIAE
jgi:L,D-transpeptidase YbiS